MIQRLGPWSKVVRRTRSRQTARSRRRATGLVPLVGAVLAASVAAAAPGLEVEQSTVDFGEVVRGAQVSAEFRLKNAGTDPLLILSAHPGCRCTLASYDKEIAPGAWGTVHADLDTTKLYGPISRAITLTTNDPVLGTLQLTMVGRVLGSVTTWPFDFVRLSNRHPPQRTATVLVRRDPTEQGELQVSDVRVDAAWIAASARPVTEAGPSARGLPDARPGDWLIDLRLTGPAPGGEVISELSFDTGLTREPRVHMAVRTDYVPLVVLSATEVVLPRGEEQVVLGALRGGTKLQQLALQTEPPELQAHVEPSGERNFKLMVSWPAAPPKAHGAVVVRALDEDYRVEVSVE